ncbi:MAG: response regulator [Deltaproteobacteria bacterium]|nr:response regulator [Deltaproteobacteria bacterium]
MTQPPDTTRKRSADVLVVDDNPDMVAMLTDLFQQRGWQVRGALGAAETMIQLETALPDALVLDIMMPDRSGIEVLEMIRYHPHYTHLPVVCLSAAVLEPPAMEFIQAFSLGLVSKNELDRLIQILSGILD